MEKLKPCPQCNGKIVLYSSCCNPYRNYNCFARCQKCGAEYPMPEAKLKTYGARIYPQSVKKAIRLWNTRPDNWIAIEDTLPQSDQADIITHWQPLPQPPKGDS